ncbi:hypothetical protein V6N13_085030 [Hibiscus sabdariffa]
MAAIPPPLPHFGSDVPGWGWDEKREFQLSSTYAFLMKAVDRNRSPKCSSQLGSAPNNGGGFFAVSPGAVEVLVADEKQRCEERLFGAESTTPICKQVDLGG